MKVKLSEHGYVLTLTREEGDPKFYGTKHAQGEHALLRFLKKWLNARGCDLVKKRIQDDGHLVGDTYQPYLRTRKHVDGQPDIYVYSSFYALRGANEDWNQGKVELTVTLDCFEIGQETAALLRAVLAE